jgi:arginine decarboxylase-like protein
MEFTITYGASLKFTYLPKISKNINKAKGWFQNRIKKHKYVRDYFYCVKISFTATLADYWVINKLLIIVVINKCNKKKEPVLLGSLKADSVSYYSSEQRINKTYLPIYKKKTPYISLFLTQVHTKSLFVGLMVCNSA